MSKMPTQFTLWSVNIAAPNVEWVVFAGQGRAYSYGLGQSYGQ